MFLSKLPINSNSRAFRVDCANVHDMHRTVMSAFPKLPSGTAARQEHAILWRLDTTPQGYTLYVQSKRHPDWARLPYGYLRDRALVRCLQPVFAALQPGRRFAFRLLGNPSKAAAEPDSLPPRGRGRRVPLHDPNEQLAWLIRQGERCGFALLDAGVHGPDVALSALPPLTGYKKARDTRTRKITITPVRYDGHLTVTDPAALATALQSGIGRGKAYGCGLLSLAPPAATP
ncbi:type I-E CRISPR-associated protein Cas6/Cse3/CasE [Saccharomonospora sp. NB11]|uniref:type I-E CRISPR-associated protein Cas6/Cse3/CasE n=1 Tax=Saccharomonospora sp. NB11 TaxID=1642298 RepID=UPI0018D0074F|nr:type I-E CRISPR-associated protein Cas6/Cse3/CasE [Saccharomonospora sp. NB11]